MLVTVGPIMTLLRWVQFWNVLIPRLVALVPTVTLLPIVALVRLRQEENAHAPMLMTLLGIVTLVRSWGENA